MVFKWKLKMSVPADEAAAELNRIYKKHGEVNPQAVVDESRAEDAVLHNLFDWDDASAAEKYRVTQARFIIRNIVQEDDSIEDSDSGEGRPTIRGYHNVNNSYLPTPVIMQKDDLRKSLLDNALQELNEFKAKYRNLKELASIFEAIDNLGI